MDADTIAMHRQLRRKSASPHTLSRKGVHKVNGRNKGLGQPDRDKATTGR